MSSEESREERPKARLVFKSRAEHETWYKKAGNKWRSILTAAEKAALVFYKGKQGSHINSFLRGTRQATQELIERVRLIDNAISKGTIEEDIVVYQGFGNHEARPSHQAGDIIEIGSFLSTSLNGGVAAEFAATYGRNGVVAEIQVPAGTHAAFPDVLDVSNDDELEMLLGRGHKLQVLSVRPHETRHHQVMLAEVVTDG